MEDVTDTVFLQALAKAAVMEHIASMLRWLPAFEVIRTIDLAEADESVKGRETWQHWKEYAVPLRERLAAVQRCADQLAALDAAQQSVYRRRAAAARAVQDAGEPTCAADAGATVAEPDDA